MLLDRDETRIHVDHSFNPGIIPLDHIKNNRSDDKLVMIKHIIPSVCPLCLSHSLFMICLAGSVCQQGLQ